MGHIDLHMHSKFSSDGEFAIDELMGKCKDANLTYMAIADHNSVKGSRIALTKQNDFEITCIPAIEIDATMDGNNYHVLGYGIDVNNPIYDKLEEDIERQEQSAGLKRIALVRELGIPFSDEDLHQIVKGGIITGEAIAEAAMMFDKEHKHPLLQPYYEGGKRSDNPYVNFYWDYCASGKPAYVHIKFPTIEEIIKLYHEQKGLAIIAHPGANMKNPQKEFAAMMALGMDGAEVYSSYHNSEQIALYESLTNQYNVLSTCGSDFHGKTKPSVYLGMCNMPEDKEQELTKALDNLNRTM